VSNGVGYALSTGRPRAVEPLKIVLDEWVFRYCAAEAIWCTSATYSCLSSLFIQILLQVRLGAIEVLERTLVTFEDCWSKIFIGQMPFLSPNRHCQYLDFSSSRGWTVPHADSILLCWDLLHACIQYQKQQPTFAWWLNNTVDHECWRMNCLR